MRNWFENVVAILTLSVFAGLAIAQQQRSVPKAPTSVPAGAKFCVQIDLNAIKQTKLGSMLFSLAKKKAIEELSKESGDEAGLAKLKEMLGMDPFEDIQSITLSSEEFEQPEKSMLAVVRLKKTAGNLEGLALGLPEYKSSEYKKYVIHSAAPDSKMRVYGAVHGQEGQDRTIVLTPNKSSIESALDHLDTVTGQQSNEAHAPLVRVQLFEIPTEKVGKGPQANIAKIVKSFMLDVEDANESIALTAKMTTETEKQAEQVQQMAQGLIAMIDFAQGMDADDKDLKKIKDMLVGLKATRDGTDVQVGLKLNADKIVAEIAEEFDLEIDVNSAQSAEAQQLREAELALEKAQQELEKLKKEVESKKDAAKKK